MGWWQVDMLTHDDLCPALNKGLVNPHVCTYCQLIRTVRMVDAERAWRDPFEDKSNVPSSSSGAER